MLLYLPPLPPLFCTWSSSWLICKWTYGLVAWGTSCCRAWHHLERTSWRSIRNMPVFTHIIQCWLPRVVCADFGVWTGVCWRQSYVLQFIDHTNFPLGFTSEQVVEAQYSFYDALYYRYRTSSVTSSTYPQHLLQSVRHYNAMHA